MSFDDLVGDKDLGAVRTYDMGNNKLIMKRTDPFGFWHLSLERGALPELYKGAYTTPSDAAHAASAYLAEKGKETKPLSS